MRLAASVLFVAVVGLSSQGCDADVTSGNGSNGGGCEAASYDLSQPPTRADFGMQPGKSYVDVSCDAGFPVTLALPEGAKVSVTARRVNADSYSTGNPETGDPTTVDVHSVGLGTDRAVSTATDLAAELGMDPRPLASWRREVEADPSGGNVDSPFLRSHLGFLTAELQVQHLGPSGTNYVHLIFTWD